MNNKNAFGLCFLVLSLLMSGCKEKPRPPAFTPLSGGFGYANQWVGLDSGPDAQLYFRDSSSNLTCIWPFFGPGSGPINISNDMAFFVASMPDAQGICSSWDYFAVQGPGPAMVITEPMLKLWADSNHFDFEKIRSRYYALEEKPVSNGIFVYYNSHNNYDGEPKPEAKMVVTWEQISNLIQDVRKTGKAHYTKYRRTVYLKKDYDSGTNQ